MILTQTISYKNSVIHINCFGAGRQQVICFHGYDESAGSFSFLEKIDGKVYSFYAVDLPFHGETIWNEDKAFTTADVVAIISKLKDIHQKEITTGNHFEEDQRIILLGFSLGGRICLSAFEQAPEMFNKVVLLAPDGLKINMWYWFATQTWMGNRIFLLTMKKPTWFFGLLNLMKGTKWINPSVYKFVHYYIADEKVRKQLYNRWTGLRKLKPNIPTIKHKIIKHQTPFQLIYGKYDRIILPVRGKKFCKDIEPFCTLKIIQSGHQVLHENHANEIIQAIKY